MRVIDRAAAFSEHVEGARRQGQSVGLVPTMGALHEGHRSLITRARESCDHVAVTIFVNPLQFDDPEDIERYPRDVERDLHWCDQLGVDSVFVPPVDELYPDGPGDKATTTVSVPGPSEQWEGGCRPGHFVGVATVVTKLLALTGRCRAFFGEKDFQQLAVIRRLVEDLCFPVEVIACPTVREPDGLALSSRNVRLSAPGRRSAVVLSRALEAGSRCLASGERRPDRVAGAMAAVVEAEPLARLDYAAAVDPASLTAPTDLVPGQAVRLLVAAQVEAVRLIDNCRSVVGPRAGPDDRERRPPEVLVPRGAR